VAKVVRKVAKKVVKVAKKIGEFVTKCRNVWGPKKVMSYPGKVIKGTIFENNIKGIKCSGTPGAAFGAPLPPRTISSELKKSEAVSWPRGPKSRSAHRKSTLARRRRAARKATRRRRSARRKSTLARRRRRGARKATRRRRSARRKSTLARRRRAARKATRRRRAARKRKAAKADEGAQEKEKSKEEEEATKATEKGGTWKRSQGISKREMPQGKRGTQKKYAYKEGYANGRKDGHNDAIKQVKRAISKLKMQSTTKPGYKQGYADGHKVAMKKVEKIIAKKHS